MIPPPPAFANGPAVSPTIDDRYLSLDELSRYASLSRRSLERFIADRDHPLRAYRIGKAVRVRKSDYDRWLAERQTAAATVGADLSPDDRRIALALRGYDGGRR